MFYTRLQQARQTHTFIHTLTKLFSVHRVQTACKLHKSNKFTSNNKIRSHKSCCKYKKLQKSAYRRDQQQQGPAWWQQQRLLFALYLGCSIRCWLSAMQIMRLDAQRATRLTCCLAALRLPCFALCGGDVASVMVTVAL